MLNTNSQFFFSWRSPKQFIFTSSGNPQSLGQKPLTFLRQLLALVEYPALMTSASQLFPADVVARAKKIVNTNPGGTFRKPKKENVVCCHLELLCVFRKQSYVIFPLIPLSSFNDIGVGAYSHSKGLPYVRDSIARFIEQRDGFSADPEHIFVHNGASPAVQDMLRLVISSPNDGVSDCFD
jgi:hypothetical protein